MSVRTLIQWCYYTFGWFGCTKVSPGCKNCYMFALAKRYHKSRNVGPGAPRVLPKYFKAAVASMSEGKRRGAPFTWDRECAKLGIRRGVFPSLCDPFDAEVPVEWSANLLALIRATPNLDWLLLTKRPQNWRSHVEAAQDWHFDHGDRNVSGWLQDWWKRGLAPANIWIGASVENQEYAQKRIPELVGIPAVVRFLSCEPLLGALDIDRWLGGPEGLPHPPGIDWVIVGGESGQSARPCDVNHIRGVVQQCQAANVPVFVKQLGKVPFVGSQPADSQNRFHTAGRFQDSQFYPKLNDKKGGDMTEWPLDLRVRQLPEVRA